MEAKLLNTVTLSELTDLIRKEFVQTQNMIVPNAKQLFVHEPVGKGQGNTKRFDEIDTQTFARGKRQGEAAKKSSVGIGYNKTVIKKRYATEIDITQEMRDENRYAEVGTLITKLTHFIPQRQELDLTHRFTFCTSSSMTDMDGDVVDLTTGDGYQLAYNAHTLKYSSTTYSNRVSGDPIFSQGGLEAAQSLAVTNILSNFGERRVMNFNTIVTGDDPNTVNNVKRILESMSDTEQNNSNVINPFKGTLRHVILPYLATTATGAHDSTKKRWWFLLASGQKYSGWQGIFAEWESAFMKAPDEDSSRDVWTYGTRGSWGIASVSPRGFIASCPTS